MNMIIRYKNNVKTTCTIVLLGWLFLLFISLQVHARYNNLHRKSHIHCTSTGKKLSLYHTHASKWLLDTLIKQRKDTSSLNDSSIKRSTIDTLKISKDSLDAPVSYQAADSGVLNIPQREFILYGKSKLQYTDLNLDAATIKYNQQTQMLHAFGGTDTGNNVLNKPQLVQGEMKSISDTIDVNLKNMHARTKNTFYNEGELYVNAQVLKKVSATEYYGLKGRFTTCNLDNPHFAIRTRKLKMISNKLAVSGPAAPEFEGVPLPIGIPFGIFPLARGRHSGLMAPQFTSSEDFGLGLEGLGYYKVINDYWDVITRANIYSYGGWSLNVSPKYQRRYRYQGGFNITFQSFKSLNRGSTSKSEYNTGKTYSISWNHSQDNRARPGTNFGANVNFASTRYNSQILNNPFVNFQNQLSSSINYSKSFNGKANININANHNQNNNTRLVNLNLPTIGANVVTFYPFQKTEKIGSDKWYEKIGIGYSGNFSNQASFYDTAFNFKRFLDTIQWGATHSIPISLSLPSLGAVTIAPSVSYEEKWYGQKIIRSWNKTNEKVDTAVSKGLYTARQMSFGISANTRIFGTYLFKRKSGIQAIRHEVRPSFSLNYKPDLAGNTYYTTQIDTSGRTMRFSQFDGVLPGTYSEGKFGGFSFGIDNLLEMKVKSKTDTSENGIKKIKLIDGFGFTSSYNLMADSFALSPFNFYARSTLFGKVNITAGFVLDPYDVDSAGFRKKTLLWNALRFKPGRITSGNIAISTSFASKAKDGKEKKDKSLPYDPYMTTEEQQRQLQYARSSPAEFTDFDIPWSANLSYSLNFTNQLGSDYKYKITTFSSLNFNGDFSISPKWKIGSSGFMDFSSGKIQQISMYLTREMHCWQMAINVSPVGLYRSFNITINPKSGILRDLRINRSRTFSNY